MDSLRVRRKAAPTSLSVKNHERFYPDKTFVQRRMSNATDFDDTDIETSDSDEESLRQSLQSIAYDSNTSISTPDLPTPENAPKDLVNIHIDSSMVQGPDGPHLFRNSRGSSLYEPSTAEIDLYFERSPLQSEFSRSIDTPRRFPFSPKTPKALTTVHPDVSHVSEEEIRSWKPNQVAHWLHIAGYNDAVIEKFLINDITGTVLLSIQTDDLKELNIHSFGMRHQIMASIEHLKNTMSTVPPVPPTPESFMTQSTDQRQPQVGRSSPRRSSPRHSSPRHSSDEEASPKRRSYAMSVSPNGEILSNHVFGNNITPGESVSIVGIEQRLPKPHNCSRGDKCSKFRRYQRQLDQIFAEHPNAVLHDGMIIIGSPGNPETARDLLRPKSNSEPSVVASSDIFGPAQGPQLSEEALNEVQKLDPQETIRNFLNYQHVDNQPPMLDTSNLPPQEEPFAGLTPPNAQPNAMAANLRNLPKLTIPTSPNTEDMTTAVTSNRSMTPTRASQIYGSPTAVQQYGPFTQARNIDVYRQGTPFTEVDVPVTAIPSGPIARDASQSVPPDMQYGHLFPPYRDPIMRSASTRPGNNQPLRRVREDRPLSPIETPEDLIRSPRQRPHGHSVSHSSVSSDPDVIHSGYLKHKKNRFLRSEWKDAHVTLRDTKVALHESEADAHRISRALDVIDVDDYAVACSSLATSSKVTAAIKRNIMRKQNRLPYGSEAAAFQFSFIPAHKEGDRKALFNKNALPRHDFIDNTADGRGEWVRKLLLAKAEKRARDNGEQMLVNGYNVI